MFSCCCEKKLDEPAEEEAQDEGDPEHSQPQPGAATFKCGAQILSLLLQIH